MKKIPICDSFPISNDEYLALEKEFGSLTKYAAWQLIKKNAKNNHTDEFEDINQELLISLLRAGCYYKRQVYIEESFEVVEEFLKECGDFLVFLLQELKVLWHNRTRHGASRQKFGNFQENLLEKLVCQIVPKEQRPKKDQSLKIDTKFKTYCKAICWNSQKSMGRKITKDKAIRTAMVSLSEHDYFS